MTTLQEIEVRTMNNEAWRRSLPERTGQYPKRPPRSWISGLIVGTSRAKKLVSCLNKRIFRSHFQKVLQSFDGKRRSRLPYPVTLQ
jgi:hypothetical protein